MVKLGIFIFHACVVAYDLSDNMEMDYIPRSLFLSSFLFSFYSCLFVQEVTVWILISIVCAGHKGLCFKQNLVDRFFNGYIWGIVDVKGIVSGSSKCSSQCLYG